jgi:tRNA 2-thiouridine synthesizing protein C
VVSATMIRPFRIRNLNEMIEQFGRNHIILGENVASVCLKKVAPSSLPSAEKGRVPPITILVTSTPYATERVFGAISLAVATAAGGIQTRVIFIEDGAYILAGTHQIEKDTPMFNIQEVIDVVAGSDGLQFFAFQPSLHRRGITKNPKMKAVLDIGMPELGQLLFSPQNETQAGHQRIIFF